MPPPSTPGFAPPQDGPKKQPPPPKQHFFEELPMSPPKLRASSAMGRYQTGPQGGLGLQGEFGGPQGGFGGPQGGLGAPPMAGGGSHNPQQPIQQGPYGPPPQTQLPFLQGSQSPQMFAQPSRYSPAPQQVSGGHAPPPTFARQSPAVPQGQGYAPPPVTQQAAPVMNAKYAPRPAGPPQPPATQYTKPPAAPQQQVYAPPPQQQAHGPPTQLQAYAPQQQQQQQQAFSSPPAQYAASPYQQDNPGSPPAAPPQQQNYGSPLSQTAAAPRRQDYGSPPAQQAAPRQQDYGSPPAQHAAPSQQDYGSPRQLDYGSPLQAQYSSPRAQQSPMSPPASFSRSSSGQPSPEGSRRLSVEQYSLHSSRPGTAAGPPPGMDIPREEEEDRANQMAPPPPPLFNSRYAPPRNTSTPPPPHNKTLVSSPPLAAGKHISPKRFVPRAISPAPESFQPPPRAQTSSPGLHYGRPKIERPSSALARSAVPGNYAPAEQQQQQRLALLDLRKDMVQLEFMAPNDISAQDTLKRWQGAPIVVWSLGGLTTMFPTRTQRFSSDMHSTVIKCSPGEVKARQLKDILPPNDDFDKFPGPVWTGNKSLNKAKKKEAISYMDTRIEGFEKTLMDIYDPSERRAAEEKCMLWKVVRIMVENDGVVEGSPEISTAVRQVLTPEIAQLVGQQGASGFIPMGGAPTMTGALAESRDPKAVDTFRQKLLSGDREAAVWHAADQGLWAHALLISGTSGKDLWKRVVEEFIKVEVRTLGEGSESLAALYATLAGNWEESVDEIVPRGARMGMPMLSNSGGQTRTAEDRLTKWRETLALILNNRSPGDQASILALGRMLANYGWTSAAHIW